MLTSDITAQYAWQYRSVKIIRNDTVLLICSELRATHTDNVKVATSLLSIFQQDDAAILNVKNF